MQACANSTDTVLVIDDDPVMRELLILLLGAEGHSVLTADSGEDALALLAALPPGEQPSILLADLTMPGLSHGALGKRLRRACPPQALLLAMSASRPAKAEAAVFDAFLAKPFSVEDYNAAVDQVRNPAVALQAGVGPEDAAAPDPSAPQDDAVPALNEAIYSKLSSVMGATQLPQLYNMFLDDAPVRIARMSSAAKMRDEAAFIREAHAIKGGCGMLGATELHALAGRMEAGGLKCSLLLNDLGAAVKRLRRILEERIPMRT
jgi:CheY-like chemotaxis protein